MEAYLIVATISAIAAAASAIIAATAVWKMTKQMKLSIANEFTRFCNEHNWDLYLKHDKLPPFLPSWKGLSERGWAWRVLFFNHLNLLKLAYDQKEVLEDEEFNRWIEMAKYWFSHLWTKNSDEVIKEGLIIFDQVLRKENAYPDEFIRWLDDEDIIYPEYFPNGE